MISVELRFHLPGARLEQKFTWKYTEILFRNRWIENYSLPYGITPARGTSIMETYLSANSLSVSRLAPGLVKQLIHVAF